MLISNKRICSLMPNLNKKSLMVSIQGVLYLFIDLRKEANITGTLMLEIVSHISLMAVQALPPVLKGISLFLQKIIWVWYEISVQKVHIRENKFQSNVKSTCFKKWSDKIKKQIGELTKSCRFSQKTNGWVWFVCLEE